MGLLHEAVVVEVLLAVAVPVERSPRRYVQLLCGRPQCAGPMRIIAFITYSADIARILAHIGVDAEASRITRARGPPSWHDCAAQEPGEGTLGEPDRDMANQSPPDYPEDQRTVW